MVLMLRGLGLLRTAACWQGRLSVRQCTAVSVRSQGIIGGPSVLQKKQNLSCAGISTGSCCRGVSASTRETQPLDGKVKDHVSVDSEGHTLTVTWKDGSTSRFHSVWLRHNCHCSECRQPHSSQRLVDPAAIPHRITISHVCFTGEQVEVEWGGESLHRGVVPVDYLKQHCYQTASLQGRRQAAALGTPVQTLPQMDYSELTSGKAEVLRWLRQINEAGISLLKNVPTEDAMVQKVAEHIGPVQDHIYGRLFDVVSTPKPINVAYSSVALDFHMDLIYYESPPGLQFLHCLRFDECCTGGESRFLDIFQVAEEFRASDPEHFSTLVRVPATFQKIHYDRDYPVEMRYQRPHIILNQYQEIVGVNWAPAFEGPLAVTQDEVIPYYAAYETFAKAIKFSPHIIDYQLRPGDLVTFNNRRILHARTKFELNGGVRHLKGCYVNIDHFKNQVTVFSRLYGSRQPTKRVGNQDWF